MTGNANIIIYGHYVAMEVGIVPATGGHSNGSSGGGDGGGVFAGGRADGSSKREGRRKKLHFRSA